MEIENQIGIKDAIQEIKEELQETINKINNLEKNLVAIGAFSEIEELEKRESLLRETKNFQIISFSDKKT